MEKFSVKQFDVSDWKAYRDMRLEALATHPTLFDPSTDETQLTEEEWQQRLTNENVCTFGVYDNDQLIGITVVRRDADEREKAHLAASYIRQAYRKKGLSRLLYEARINWAKEQKDIKFVYVDHFEDNEASFRAHQKFGFTYDSSYEEVTLLGQLRKSVVYKLAIL